MADGSLKFDTKIDTDGFEKGTKTLKDRVNGVINSLKRAGTGAAGAFSDTGSIDLASTKIQDLVNEIDRYKDALYYLEKQGMYFGDKEYDETYQKLSKAEQSLNQYKKELAGANIEQKKVATSNKRMNESLKKTTRASIPLTKSIFKLSNMFKLLVLRMIMRSAIKAVQEGFRNLAQYSNQANKDMSALKTSMQTLQNSFATAFAPILTAVTPALQTLIGHLSNAITLLGQFFATMLTGATTFTKAKDAQVDYAKSIAKSGKEANKALSPIDKLNVVGGGGEDSGGYSGPTPGEMFEEVEIDSGVLEFAEKVKELFTPAIESFKSLAEALTPIAEFTWTNIKNFFNEFLAPVGEWILGEGLPGLIGALKDLIKNIDWKNLSEALKKLYEALAPMAISIGTGFVNFVKDLAKFLSPVLSVTVDALAFALSALADIIDNISPEAWENVGYAIGVVGTSIAGIKITSGLAPFLASLGTGFSAFAAGFNTLAFLNPIALPALFDLLGLDEWGSDFYEALPGWITGLWEGLWQTMYDLILVVFNYDETFAIWELVANAFKTAFNSDNWAEIGANIITGIFAGIFGILGFIIEPITDFFTALWNGFKEVFGIASPAKKMMPIGEYILLGIFEGFKSIFKKWWNGIVAWGSSTKTRFGTQAKAVWLAIQTPFLYAKSWFSGKFTQAFNAIKKVFAPAGRWFNDLWEGVKNGFGTAMGGLKDVAKGPINAVIGMLNKLIDAINSIEFSMPDWGWLPNSIQGQSVGFNLKRIPRLATGTVVPANYGEFMAVLGDNKRETEVVSPLSTMKQAMKEVLAEMGGAGGGEYTFIAQIDGRTIFKETVTQDKLHRSQTGKSAFAY